MSQGGVVSNFEWKNFAAVFATHLAHTLGMFCKILNQTHVANSHSALGQLFWVSGKCVLDLKVLKRLIQNTPQKGPLFGQMEFVSRTKKSGKRVVKWIPLRIRVCSRNTQPHLTPVAGLNFAREKSPDSWIFLSEF